MNEHSRPQLLAIASAPIKLCRTGVLNPMALRLEVVVSDVKKVVKSSVLLMWRCCGDGDGVEVALLM